MGTQDKNKKVEDTTTPPTTSEPQPQPEQQTQAEQQAEPETRHGGLKMFIWEGLQSYKALIVVAESLEVILERYQENPVLCEELKAKEPMFVTDNLNEFHAIVI